MEDFSTLIDWSRAHFAMTAIVHWCFVPLTMGLAFIIAILETQYVRTGDESYKRITKFWMKVFGANFIIGASTGLILEFEFGNLWSNYSYFVGDLFGAPLAIEGIMAFFLESTFIAVMLFGWNKVSKKFHLTATWLTAVGACLSALWILVANAWMQAPVGMEFNPETARNEMTDFWAIVFSPVAINKYFHTVTSCFVLGSVFVMGISSWYLLKKRELDLAMKSIKVAAIFGLISALACAYTGDGSAKQVARVQPMKLAALENIQDGSTHAPFSIIPGIEVPSMLSIMSYGSSDAFVAGVNDFKYGNKEQGILSFEEKKERGTYAKKMFSSFIAAKKADDTVKMAEIAAIFKDPDFQKNNYAYFGYSYLEKPEDMVPPIALNYWMFRIMAYLGGWFLLIFSVTLFLMKKGKLQNNKLWLTVSLWSIPTVYLASNAGWVVAEVGRQPWTIQDILPVQAAVSDLGLATVQGTFIAFAILFAVLITADVIVLTKIIKKGSE